MQLKATDEPDLARALQVKVKAFRYLQNLNAPALLVLYHAPSRRLFGHWVHDLDVFYAGRSASCFTFRLAESDTLEGADIAARITGVMKDWKWVESPTLHGPSPSSSPFTRLSLAARAPPISRTSSECSQRPRAHRRHPPPDWLRRSE